MKQGATAVLLGLTLSALSVVPAEAQAWFFPDYALPSMVDGPSSWVAGSYGRGLNDESGKLDAIGAAYGRTGESASFQMGFGFVTGDGDDELTLGFSIGTDVYEGDSGNIAIQGGLGWMSPGDLTMLRFPIGVAWKGMMETDSGGAIVPWVMPRLNIVRISGFGDSETETDIGLSGGLTINFASGVGIHTALDFWDGDGGDPILLGLGIHYVLGSN